MLCAVGASLHATETENQNIRVLPVPGKLTVDGTASGWDLSGGVFCCWDVENQRDKMAVWLHAMYDAENFYILARFTDETPLSNPGSTGGDMGFQGDSLQLRIVVDPENHRTPMCWLTAWRDRDGKDVIDLAFPYDDKHLAIKDAKEKGAKQAFTVNADGKGYIQEMSIPWALLRAAPFTPKAGQKILLSAEPNFNTSAGYRISMKDIFRPGITPDRVFSFRAIQCWGFATFMPKGNVEPQSLRLADAREFTVTMDNGVPAIDWTGLFESKQREGFVNIEFEMPEDGTVSLNIKNAEGRVVRQLLTAEFFTKGKHSVPWDGLSNMSHLRPGEVVEAGDYTWEAIYHKGIGLRLVGWADNAGRAPYDIPGGNWGGDHGAPHAVATDGESMYLGWSGAEAGQGIVCTDLEGNVKWRHKQGGFGNAHQITVLDGIVYVYNKQQSEKHVYRLTALKGEYSDWEGSDSAMLEVGDGVVAMESRDGKLYLAQNGEIRILDTKTGKELKKYPVPGIKDLALGADGSVYVLRESSGGILAAVQRLEAVATLVEVPNATCLTVDAEGNFYVGVRNPDNQVKVFNKEGKLTRTIGKQGGRPLVGKWDKDGMLFIQALCLDKNGVLWVAEHDEHPKRFSCWNAADGTFKKEFFGPTAYGAGGGAISPEDPLVMVGTGCEWKLDPETGKSECVGVFTRMDVAQSRFGRSPDGRLYVVIGSGRGYRPTFIYERIAAGEYKLRTRIDAISEDIHPLGFLTGKITGLRVWSDANDDQTEQWGEVKVYKLPPKEELGGWISGWYANMSPDLTFYGGLYQIAPTGWTACGAPLYDLAKAKKLPAPENWATRKGYQQPSQGSADGTLVLYNGQYAAEHSDFQCFDIESGKLLWTYPNNYVGVHGGHRAPPPQVGMIRAAYDIVGVGTLPEPIGEIFVIATDRSEWHVLTGRGFYLTHLFEPDLLKFNFPNVAVPGAITDNIPPGLGAEDFGGSIEVGDDGNLYIQAGKTAYVNHRVVGLDTVRELKGGAFTVSEGDLVLANEFREKLAQASVGTRIAMVKKQPVEFTGDLRKDFGVKDLLTFQKKAADRTEVAIGYDDEMLYLGFNVTDATPWVNGASDAAEMYTRGDTVDFQVGANAAADKKRGAAALGDMRISIGNLKGKPTAVLFKPISEEKAPRKFFSGIVRDGWEVQFVKVLENAKIEVKADAKDKRYVVEAAIPLKDIGFAPVAGTSYSGDVGVTFGDTTGAKTILRSYWNNQATGIVADDVYELALEPKNWGQILFE